MSSKKSNSVVGLGCFIPILGITLLVYFFFQHSFILGLFIGVTSIIVSLFIFGIVSQMEEKRKQQQLEFLQTFQPKQVDSKKLKSYTSYDLLTKIAVDPKQKKVYVWIPNVAQGKTIKKVFAGMSYVIKTYDFSDLLAVQYTEEGHPMASAQRDTNYTNFLLNKVREEDSETNRSARPPIDKVDSVAIDVIVNDTTESRHRIHFYHEPYRHIRKDSPKYKAFYNEAYKLFSLLEKVVHETEQNLEVSMETASPTINEEVVVEPSPVKKTHITVELDTKQPEWQLSKEYPSLVENKTESITKEKSKEEQTVEKPTSYFEQLVEKNRRQLRGDYSDE